MAISVESTEYVVPSREHAALGSLAVAGMASIGAGAVHAAAVGAHSEHHQAVLLFVVVAGVQLGWGAVALVRSSRWLAWLGVAMSAVLITGWVLAKARGLDMVAGMGDAEPVQMADAVAAGLAGLSLVGAATVALTGRKAGPTPFSALLAGIVVPALTLTGMVAAGGHTHAAGHSHDGAAATGADAVVAASVSPTTHAHTDGTSHDQPPAAAPAAEATAPTGAGAVAPPKPYDPTKPIDLGGVPGVSEEQQARAENLIAVTLARLPQFADPAVAEARGYRSIGDGLTGHEHYISWSLINDDKTLDPDFPESLVYEISPGQPKKLVSAMFMLREGDTLDSVPDVGGPLMQWHVHDDLCFTEDPSAPRVAGVTSVGGSCPPPLKKLTPVPMIHVWITPHACGPFAALEGVGAGQVKSGETHLCDHAHGSH